MVVLLSGSLSINKYMWRQSRSGSCTEPAWDVIASCRRSNEAFIGSNYAVTRHSYHWLMTNHALVKKKIVADAGDGGAADCSCSEPETRWHVMGMGSCNSYPTIRQRFSGMREVM